MTSGWYPVALYCELQALAQRVLQRGSELARRIGYVNLWLDLIGAAEAAIEIAGGERVRSRVVSGGRDGHDELELRWTRR